MSNAKLEGHFRRLTIDWFRRLAADQGWKLGPHTKEGHTITFGKPDDEVCLSATFIQGPPYFRFESNDAPEQDRADQILIEAWERARRHDYGGVIWYSATCREVPMSYLLLASLDTLLARTGGAPRLIGWARLGPEILLEFREDAPPEGSVGRGFMPAASVDVHMAVPGPVAGYSSDHLAHTFIEIAVAACGFAMGRPLTLPPRVHPAAVDEIPRLEAQLADPRVRDLQRRGASLHIILPTGIPVADEYALRGEALLRTFDAAMREEHRSVATLLYVIAMECVATPNQPWKRSRSRERFLAFCEELIPNDLDQTIRRDHFEQTFRIRRSNHEASALRTALLNRIYSYRSRYAHEGLDHGYASFAVFDVDDVNRRATVRWLSEATIVNFLKNPRSSLVGHPELETKVDDG